MKSMGSRRTPGRRAASLVVLATALIAGCLNYGFSGGGGFPADVRTLYIAPFENRTVQFDLEQQLFAKLQEELPRSLGVRPGSEAAADAVVRGRITGYTDIAQNYRPGEAGAVNVVQHQVSISIAIEIIHVERNEILWESQSLSGRGEYRPESQTDEVARDLALESLVQQIIDGAQSQW